MRQQAAPWPAGRALPSRPHPSRGALGAHLLNEQRAPKPFPRGPLLGEPCPRPCCTFLFVRGTPSAAYLLLLCLPVLGLVSLPRRRRPREHQGPLSVSLIAAFRVPGAVPGARGPHTALVEGISEGVRLVKSFLELVPVSVRRTWAANNGKSNSN